MQKAIQNALAQQKTEYQSLLEKQKADFQSQMVQQTKKIPPPVPPKNMEQLLDTYESANPFPDTLTREEIMRVVAKAYGPPPKPQKPEKLQSSRIDRLESKIDEIDSDNEEDGYDKVENGWYYALEKKQGNSKHITDSLIWYTDVPVTLKDKEDKTVTVIGNFVRIDNGETEPMLFFGMSNIRKVQGVPEPNKNQFRIKLHGKTYIIPTFSKAPVVKDLPRENQESANSSNLISKEDLKKSAKSLKSTS
ncbi:hypothetical protein RhiirA1_447279 [Rhizophagus irregularis]|uniref:Uncharacterized protein n=1 Tax=Rhizophagus irregularis TaxID=588596 RepID=A0A2N0QQK7_9GLOM|nr:hypothetical protein RhiirA1_447279 [Rhizophagus irregularis]